VRPLLQEKSAHPSVHPRWARFPPLSFPVITRVMPSVRLFPAWNSCLPTANSDGFSGSGRSLAGFFHPLPPLSQKKTVILSTLFEVSFVFNRPEFSPPLSSSWVGETPPSLLGIYLGLLVARSSSPLVTGLPLPKPVFSIPPHKNPFLLPTSLHDQSFLFLVGDPRKPLFGIPPNIVDSSECIGAISIELHIFESELLSRFTLLLTLLLLSSSVFLPVPLTFSIAHIFSQLFSPFQVVSWIVALHQCMRRSPFRCRGSDSASGWLSIGTLDPTLMKIRYFPPSFTFFDQSKFQPVPKLLGPRKLLTCRLNNFRTVGLVRCQPVPPVRLDIKR